MNEQRFNIGNSDVKDFGATATHVETPDLAFNSLGPMNTPAAPASMPGGIDRPAENAGYYESPLNAGYGDAPSPAPGAGYAPQAPAAPAPDSHRVVRQNPEAPKFTVVSAGKESWANFSRDYKPAEMEQVPCVAETTMLMQYMVAMERHRATTLSFPACGVDPKVFYEHKEKCNPDGPMVLEVDTGSPDGTTTAEYEMVEVDGVNYLSCTTDCLDPDYMHSIIAEATEAIYTHNKYVFTLVGPKPVESNMRGEGEPKVFVETLRLNSYELSALIGYMESITGVTVEHGSYNGRAAMTFKRA